MGTVKQHELEQHDLETYLEAWLGNPDYVEYDDGVHNFSDEQRDWQPIDEEQFENLLYQSMKSTIEGLQARFKLKLEWKKILYFINYLKYNS